MNETLEPFGVGIIGCGRIVGHHVAAIDASSDLQLLAVCDLDEQRARDMAPRSEVNVYRDYHRMMEENSGIDVVAIATPSGLHFPQAREVVERWGKSVVIEKPPTLKFTELDDLIEAATHCGAQVFPVFQYRFNAPVQRILRGIEEGDLGAPRIVSIRQRWCRTQRYYDQSAWRGTYSLDGGALTNQGIHHLDLGNPRPGLAERVTDHEQLIGRPHRLVEGLGQTRAAGIMQLNGRMGKFRLQGIGLDDGAARAGGTGPQKFREGRLAGRRGEDATIAREILADRSGENPAAGAFPVEIGHARQQTSHIPLLGRQRGGDDLAFDPQLLQLFHD